MNLPFFAADTLGVTIHQIKSHLKASEVHQIEWGPWRVEMQVDVDSDIAYGHEMGFWVTLAKTLRLYLIVRDKESWLCVLDAVQLERCAAETGLTGLTIKSRLVEIRPAIVGVFTWANGNGWVKELASSLIGN